ncbi:hypothetical protein ACSHUI_00740 [Bacillus subtilis]|uniref:hypothetical protein n=1 Tax=Bacillus subtilis TaxID=1423 RepID=UPI0025C8E7D4|nr:hypothetical protein [Bacillus subtilis]GLI90582.1 hypothetical protein ANABIO4_39340 [Bacillus subtilis]
MNIKFFVTDKALEENVRKMIESEGSLEPSRMVRIRIPKDSKQKRFEGKNQDFYRHVKIGE